MQWAQILCGLETAALCQVPRRLVWFMLVSVLPHFHSYRYCFATALPFGWVDIAFRIKWKTV